MPTSVTLYLLLMGQTESVDGIRTREDATRVSPPTRTFPAEFSTRFDVLEEVGKGSFGKVYKVRDKKTKTVYATKHLQYNSSNMKEAS